MAPERVSGKGAGSIEPSPPKPVSAAKVPRRGRGSGAVRAPWSQRGDEAVIAACVAGDQAAWNELVDRYGRLVYAIPRRYGLDPEACDDIFQEVFSILVRQLPRIRRRSGLPKWFITTTHRVCRAWFGRARRRAGADPHPAEAAAPPPELILQLERQHIVRQALRRLGGPCERLLTALYTDHGATSYEDVSRLLNVPIGSIGPMRARCLAKLLDLIERLEREQRT
jgi:RNA polymerase sigma factor (sigma-70 family)